MDFANAVEVYRVVVNAPCSQGAAGMGTSLAPTFTIGTGFFGRSSVGENIGPQHLVNWTRIAWPDDAEDPVDDLRLRPAGPQGTAARGALRRRAGQVAAAPRPRDARTRPSYHALRDEIRRIIAEELRSALKG